MNYRNLFSVLYYIGMALVLIGVFTQLSGSFLGGYIIAAGVSPIIGVRAFNRWVASKERARINSVLLLSSVFLAGSAVAIFMHKSYWILFVFIAALLDGYASFRKLT